jgi:molybdopterin-guanine dinucleotide biosynthesis protein A
MNNNEVTGFVLSGGMSKRMGEEKGLALFNNKPLVSYAIDALQPICGKIYISANDQLESYAQLGHDLIKDDIRGIGPMGGIISCLKRSESRYNIILSCDTPFVRTELFADLLKEIDNHQVAVPEQDDFIEPLCAVYATNVIWEMEAFIEKGNYKLTDFVESTNLKRVAIHSSLPYYEPDMFTNINTRQDLKNSYG